MGKVRPCPWHLQMKRKVGWVGLEPTTNALKGRCSTIELPTRIAPAFCSQRSCERLGIKARVGLFTPAQLNWQEK